MTAPKYPQPVWVVPHYREVADLMHVAAYSADTPNVPAENRDGCDGVLTALAWVCGYRPGPVTGRDETPVSLDLALAEWHTAATIMGHQSTEDLVRFCATAGVRYWPARDVAHQYALGAWITLRWLLGDEEDAPLSIPLRHHDGSLVTATEIYDVLLADQPHADARLRERFRHRAARTAEKSEQAAVIVAAHVARIVDARQA